MSLKEKRKSLREELVWETCLSDKDINFIISKINRKIEQLKKKLHNSMTRNDIIKLVDEEFGKEEGGKK